MNVVETYSLGKSYGATKALQNCNLAIPEGHVVALVGPNGAGKSTLLNLAVGLATPTSGELTVLGGYRAGSLPALDGIGFRCPGHAAVQEPVGRRHAACHPESQPALRPGLRRGPVGRAGHPSEAQGGQAVGRTAGPARVDIGAGPPTAPPRAR